MPHRGSDLALDGTLFADASRSDMDSPLRIEPRWPVAFAVLAVALLLTILPDRVRALPVWVPIVLGIVLIAPLVAVMLTRAQEPWLRIERAITLVFCVVAGSGMIVGLSLLIAEMVRRSGAISGIQLLTSSVAVWVLNVITFSLIYWQIDRGGPEPRANNASPGRTGFPGALPRRTCRTGGSRRSSTTSTSAIRRRPRSARPMSCR